MLRTIAAMSVVVSGVVGPPARAGNRVSIQDGLALVVPDALSLEFVDAAGKVLWVASTVVATRTPR